MRIRLRRLHIGERAFVWRAEIGHVEGSSDCHRRIRVRVWGGGRNGQALQADLLSTAWGTPWTACATDGSYPTSGDVRALIDFGLAHGWEPDRRGGTFVLPEESGFALPASFTGNWLVMEPGGADPTARVSSLWNSR
ncbi:integrase [Actinoplanes sp. CA-142083]|uniref:integrase n=1 Tax=Actinoplanes sp. CA-142083 TaxID=3239903 RepID=UPI003D92C1CA